MNARIHCFLQRASSPPRYVTLEDRNHVRVHEIGVQMRREFPGLFGGPAMLQLPACNGTPRSSNISLIEDRKELAEYRVEKWGDMNASGLFNPGRRVTRVVGKYSFDEQPASPRTTCPWCVEHANAARAGEEELPEQYADLSDSEEEEILRPRGGGVTGTLFPAVDARLSEGKWKPYARSEKCFLF